MPLRDWARVTHMLPSKRNVQCYGTSPAYPPTSAMPHRLHSLLLVAYCAAMASGALIANSALEICRDRGAGEELQCDRKLVVALAVQLGAVCTRAAAGAVALIACYAGGRGAY